MEPMGRYRFRKLAILFAVGTLICADCAYVIHTAVERGQWFPLVGGALITFIVAFVLAVAVIRS
jgi:hypothetical protein